ncbi:3950_t:CDS:2, partial [Cetraspora pellucida]
SVSRASTSPPKKRQNSQKLTDDNDLSRQSLVNDNDQRTEQVEEIISDGEDNLEDISHEETSVNDSDFLNELTTEEISHIATSSKSITETTATVLPSSSRSIDEIPTGNQLYTEASNLSAKVATSTATSLNKDRENNFEYNVLQKAFMKLRNASNEFEVAVWVAYHPKILDLANMIFSAQKAKITESDETSSNTTNLSNFMLSSSEITKHTKYRLQEECKALFLRTRNNTTQLYEELITKVCNIQKSDYRMGTLLKDMGNWFDIYRYRLNQAVSNLADEFSASHNWSGEPSMSAISDFISDDVWKQVLKLHLKSTDLPVLQNDHEMFMKLGDFVCQAVRKVLIAQTNGLDPKSAIRRCDKITLDLKIPTKLGIIKTLSVRELLS